MALAPRSGIQAAGNGTGIKVGHGIADAIFFAISAPMAYYFAGDDNVVIKCVNFNISGSMHYD